MDKDQSGFTLLELLIAMTLLGLILVMMYSGLRLGMRSWDVGEQRAESTNEMRLVQGFLRRQLEQSALVYLNDPDRGWMAYFSGKSQSLTMVTPMLTHLGLGGLYVVYIDLIQERETSQLRMRWHPYRPDGSGVEAADETVLLDGVSQAQWAYFGSIDPNGEPQWYEQWQGTHQRPLLIRLSLTTQDERWPDLIARLPN